MYTRFADIYDSLTKDIYYTEWADYLQSAFRKFNIDPKLILDLGCGTGSMAIELSKRNYDMIALDSSIDMLNRAYKKAVESNANILYLNQDMRSFELFGTVDVVLSLLDSINYITSYHDLKKTFKLVNNYLNPGGLFIFDVNSPYKLEKVLGNETFYELNEGIAWIWNNTYDKKSKTTTFDLTFFVKQQNGMYERFDEIHKERVYTSLEIEEALKNADLELIGEYGNLSFDPPRIEEERIFYVARKV